MSRGDILVTRGGQTFRVTGTDANTVYYSDPERPGKRLSITRPGWAVLRTAAREYHPAT